MDNIALWANSISSRSLVLLCQLTYQLDKAPQQAIAIKEKKIYQAVTTMTLNSYDEEALRVNLIPPDEISRYPQGLKLQAVAVYDG